MSAGKLKVLQVGGGAMGTRRMRDLCRRPDLELRLYDQRADRRAAAKSKFGVVGCGTLAEALAWGPAALIISTPPGAKGEFIDLCFKRKLHHFSEADIWTYGAAQRSLRAKDLVATTSCSLRFLPVVRGLEKLVRDQLGDLLSYHHALGTYMPSWHPTEGREYYGRHRNTAPAREMVCFDLHFLNAVFGPTIEVAGSLGKFGALAGNIEDTWSLLMRLETGGTGHLTSTMASKENYRRGCCLGTKSYLTWDLYTGEVEVSGKRRRYQFGQIDTVLDASYQEEINTFIDAVQGQKVWPQSYAMSQQATAILAAAEQSAAKEKWVQVTRDAEPKLSPPRPR